MTRSHLCRKQFKRPLEVKRLMSLVKRQDRNEVGRRWVVGVTYEPVRIFVSETIQKSRGESLKGGERSTRIFSFFFTTAPLQYYLPSITGDFHPSSVGPYRPLRPGPEGRPRPSRKPRDTREQGSSSYFGPSTAVPLYKHLTYFLF